MKTSLALAVKFEIRNGKIVLFDAAGKIVKGSNAKWVGDFYCADNQLTSLEGAPREVGGDFYCADNQLTSLEGAPREVGGDFYCHNNQLTSLEGAPREVGGHFYCHNNQLTSLEGAPREVGGGFYCAGNQLTSLEGAPREVGGDFYCAGNQLTSLEGAPREVGGGFYCHNNQLTSLEGAPREVGGSFYCAGNQLTSLEGAPREVGGHFYCAGNQLTSLEGAPRERLEVRQEIKNRIAKAWGKRKILWADDIMSKIIKSRGNLFQIRIYGKAELSWAVTDGENWSHGKTVKEAKDDLIFKISKRDISEFQAWDASKKREVKELISAYRSITGACAQGVKIFCEKIDMGKKYSVLDVIEKTKGAYGSEAFRNFFKGGAQ